MNLFFKPKSLTRFFVGNDFKLSTMEEAELSAGLSEEEDTDIAKKAKTFYTLAGEASQGKNKRFKDGVPAEVRILPKNVEEILKGEGGSSYDPLEEAPNLYTEMAKIDYFDESSLQKFVDNFGLPEGTDLFASEVYSVCHHEMDLFSFYANLSEYKRALYVYEAIQNNDKKALEGYVAEYEAYVKEQTGVSMRESGYTFMLGKGMDYISERVEQLGKEENLSETEALAQIYGEGVDQINQPPDILKRWAKVAEESPEMQAKYYLIELLNKWGKGNSSFELIGGQIHPGTTFQTLLEVAYFQLSRAVTGNMEMKRCENCNSLFEATHESRRFCPPMPGAKVSTCQNTYNQRMKRKRKKDKQKAADLAADGVAVQQIADGLKRDQEEIKAWLSEGK